MKDYIEERAISIANYIIDNNATVRQTAKKFGISKSTVHKDVAERLLHINPALARQARVCWTLTNRKGTSGAEWLPGRNICISMCKRKEAECHTLGKVDASAFF